MKKITLALVFIIAMASFSFAQKFGFKGGVNFSKLDVSYQGYTMTTKATTNAEVGFMSDFKINDSFYFSPELLFVQKGGKIGTVEQHLGYIEDRMNLTLKYGIDKAFLFVKSGPYAAVGVIANNDAKFGTDLKRMDLGWGFGAGVEYSVIQLGFNYGLGLLNVNTGNDGDVKNRTASFTLGIFF
ncbi:MAG: outer membrane beta-barrel protein [Bacteroidota bacterium]|nr:outer membrane beta-barrel protein [Bacteroidota bacterium]